MPEPRCPNCGQEMPYGPGPSLLCEKPEGHEGPHRSGLTAWWPKAFKDPYG